MHSYSSALFNETWKGCQNEPTYLLAKEREATTAPIEDVVRDRLVSDSSVPLQFRHPEEALQE